MRMAKARNQNSAAAAGLRVMCIIREGFYKPVFAADVTCAGGGMPGETTAAEPVMLAHVGRTERGRDEEDGGVGRERGSRGRFRGS